MISDDIRCECGHVYEDHYEDIYGGDDRHDECHGNTGTERQCSCKGFEAAEIQDFCGHPFKPVEIRTI